jgi:starch synthase
LKVVTSHPAKQVVVYSIAAQLHQRQLLANHIASVYYDPTKLRYRVWQSLPRIGPRIDYQLQKRSSPDLPANLVDDGPWVELVLAALAKAPVARRLLAIRPTYQITNWFHDRRAARWIRRHRSIDAVIAFQGAALNSLIAAKAIGATAVLMAMHPLDHHQIVAQEYARFGRTVSSKTPARLLKEIAVADHIVSASLSTTEALVSHGVPRGKIKEIPYGIDTDSYSSSNPETAVDPDYTRFLFVGKLSVHKGLHVLRDAFQRITNPNIKLTLVGRPVGEVERHILQFWKDPRVEVVAEVDSIRTAYARADVFVFPSLVEGFGMVTLEAMASGVPVIVTTRCASVVRDGIDGYVVEPGSADQLVEKMSLLAGAPATRKILGQNALERSREFTWNRFGDIFGDWLLQVTNTPSPTTETGADSLRGYNDEQVKNAF